MIDIYKHRWQLQGQHDHEIICDFIFIGISCIFDYIIADNIMTTRNKYTYDIQNIDKINC